MNWIASTLWDLIAPKRSVGRKPATITPRSDPVVASVRKAVAQSPTAVLIEPKQRRAGCVREAGGVGGGGGGGGRKASMQDRYDALVEEMKALHNVRVRKWRKSSSGVARLITYHNGKQVRLIESPYPRGPMSCAIFMHEIGHHAIGLGVYKPRCLEEYHVWVWALRGMRDRGFNVTPAVERRFHDSMKYAVRKARRRGLQSLPVELQQYL